LPKVVYLDQNAWIELFKEREGKTHNGKIEAALLAVTSASSAGEAVFPMSIVHLMETAHIGNERKRLRLGGFMYSISMGYTIFPFTSAIRLEVRDLVRRMKGLPPANLRGMVVGRGIGGMFGARPSISYAVSPPKEIQDLLQRVVESPRMIRWALRNKEVMKHARELRKLEGAIVAGMEKDRLALSKIRDPKLRRTFDLRNYLVGDLLSKFAAAAIEMDLDKSKAPLLDTPQALEEFLQRVPTAYALWTLSYHRDVQFQRPIKGNDFHDVAALSVAIPYSDIVITEKMFADIAHKGRLDSVDRTLILSSVESLASQL